MLINLEIGEQGSALRSHELIIKQPVQIVRFRASGDDGNLNGEGARLMEPEIIPDDPRGRLGAIALELPESAQLVTA